MRKENRENRNKKGFTLVETLAAISVLMISIVAPLAIASKGISYAEYARNEITAYYLAQEAVDVLRNMRDGSWADLEAKASECGNPEEMYPGCQIDSWKYLGGEADAVKPCTDEVGCRVWKYVETEIVDGVQNIKSVYFGGIGHTFGNQEPEESSFVRVIKMEPLQKVGADPAQEIRIKVIVDWDSKVGGISSIGGKGRVLIYEDLFNLQ